MATRTGNDELHDPRWLGAILPIFLAYLLLISQPQHQGGGGSGEGNAAAPARFDSVTASSLCFTIALISLTSSRPLPPSKGLKICLFHLILGSAVLLSSSVPKMLMLRWLPYFSCIRPFFHLLPLPLQLPILHSSKSVWEATKRYVGSLFDMLPDRFRLWVLQSSQSAIRQLVTVDSRLDAQPSSPVPPIQTNINSEMVELLQNGITNIASTFLAPSSSQAQLNLEGVHVHPSEDIRNRESITMSRYTCCCSYCHSKHLCSSSHYWKNMVSQSFCGTTDL